MGEGVDGPHVVRRGIERGPGTDLRLAVAGVLLESEGEDALDVAPSRLTGVPGRDDLLGDPEETGAVAQEEVEVLGHPQGEQVAWLVEQRPLEPVARPHPVAVEPRAGGPQVQRLPFPEAVGGLLGLLQRHGRELEALGRGPVEGEIGAQDMAEHRTPGGRHGGVRDRDRIAGEGHQVLHGVAEQRHGGLVRRLERDTPPVAELDVHGASSPSWAQILGLSIRVPEIRPPGPVLRRPDPSPAPYRRRRAVATVGQPTNGEVP